MILFIITTDPDWDPNLFAGKKKKEKGRRAIIIHPHPRRANPGRWCRVPGGGEQKKKKKKGGGRKGLRLLQAGGQT